MVVDHGPEMYTFPQAHKVEVGNLLLHHIVVQLRVHAGEVGVSYHIPVEDRQQVGNLFLDLSHTQYPGSH